ncbi:MAG: ATP-binding cassette domain-containing protein [Anaerolineae bacterium]|jgi:energy-coupling factor transport system ATP-binding protein
MLQVLQADQAAYRYPQSNRGLQSFSLLVHAAEQVLITGPSGCGKSTLARCLTGLIPHLYRGNLDGQVWVEGQRTVDLSLWQLAERVGTVFQNPAAQMLAESVEEEIVFGLENLGLARDEIGARLEATLTRFGLQEMHWRSPQTLSGGEQQKLALASIIARRPRILVLDEPLSMLDSTAAIELVAYLNELVRSGTSVVVCEHREEYFEDIPNLRTHRLHGPAVDGQTVPQLRTAPVGPQAAELEVSDLAVTLGGRTILSDLSFSAGMGQILAIVGRNGVGKTTLLRALAGLQAHAGSVAINGSRPDLGLVFQNPDLQLFNPSVREEVLYRLSEPDMKLYEWLMRALGLDRYQDVPPLLLSEGEKKRVALATVLMRKPRHGILLDEPSLGQDVVHKAQLVGVARALAEAGQIVILTTHDLALVTHADRLLLLGPDGFVAQGTPGDVLDDEAAWRQLGLRVPEWITQQSTWEKRP